MAQPSTPEPRSPEPRTYDELVASKTGAFRRLYTIVCVIILEILQRMAMMDNPNVKPLPSTVLARAIAGDSFGLPAPLAATLRLLARELRRWVELPAPQAQPEPVAPQPQPRAAPRRRAPARARPIAKTLPSSAPLPARPRQRFFKIPQNLPPGRTPFSFRYSNESPRQNLLL